MTWPLSTCGLPLQFLCHLARKSGGHTIELCRRFMRVTLDTDACSNTARFILSKVDSRGRDGISNR